MNPIPQEHIDSIPDSVEATRESCQLAADKALFVLFFMANELKECPEFPPIISNGAEVWPLPAPWTSDEESVIRLLLNLNGRDDDPGLLPHVKRNASEYNEALQSRDIPVAEKIASQGPDDAAALWNDTNSLALESTKESNFKTLVLSDETKEMFERLSRRS